jgi:hypothetical protein
MRSSSRTGQILDLLPPHTRRGFQETYPNLGLLSGSMPLMTSAAVEAELKPEPIGTWGVGMAYLLLMPLIGSAMAQHFGTRDVR